MDQRDPDAGSEPGVPGGFLLLRQGESLRDGRYVLERRLGAGGMAAVWLARDELLGRAVAIKLMSETIVDEPAWLERFRREARVAAGLSHPNLVEVYDFEPSGARPYLVMAHVPGGTLADRLRDGDPPEPRRLAAELLAALGHMHAAGVLHRDVKPSNVMLGADGAARLGDFGISRPRDAPAVTETGQVLGSARYMAPEVMAGEEFTERADLYSTGIVLSELLAEWPDEGLEWVAAELAADAPEDRPGSARVARQRVEGLAPSREAEPTATTRVEAPRPVVPAPAPAPREEVSADEPPRSFVPPPPIERRPRGPRIAVLAAVVAVLAAAGVIALVASGGGGGSGSGSDAGGQASSGSGSGSSSSSDSGSGGSGSTDGSDSSGSGSGSGQSGSGSGSSGSGADASGSGSSAGQGVVPEPTASDPAQAAALDEQGRQLIDSGDPESAIPILRRAVIASDPDSGDTYAFALYNLGNALRLAGKPQNAVAVLEARLQVPNQIPAVQAELDQAISDAGFD